MKVDWCGAGPRFAKPSDPFRVEGLSACARAQALAKASAYALAKASAGRSPWRALGARLGERPGGREPASLGPGVVSGVYNSDRHHHQASPQAMRERPSHKTPRSGAYPKKEARSAWDRRAVSAQRSRETMGQRSAVPIKVNQRTSNLHLLNFTNVNLD